MKDCNCSQRPGRGVVFLLCLAVVVGGCQAKEPPLSKATVAFKQEVKDALHKLSSVLIEPVSEGDVGNINSAIQKVYSKAIREGRPLAFAVAILDKDAVRLTSYPSKPYNIQKFSNYRAVVKALKKRQIAQGRLYLQGGAQLYVVCSPLLRQGKLAGVLILCLNSPKVNQKWGVSEEEFLAINFNQ
jgi:hypothetical protein